MPDTTTTDVRQYETYLKLLSETEDAIAHLSDRIDESSDPSEGSELLARKNSLETRMFKMVQAQVVFMTTASPKANSAVWRLRKTVKKAESVSQRLKKLDEALAAADDFLGIVTRLIKLVS